MFRKLVARALLQTIIVVLYIVVTFLILGISASVLSMWFSVEVVAILSLVVLLFWLLLLKEVLEGVNK